MEGNIIYYVLGILGVIYLAIFFKNKQGKRRRKSRKFMDGKRRHGNEQ